MKRIELKPVDVQLEMETQPWILLEFNKPSESRDLSSIGGNANFVRTATRDGHIENKDFNTFKTKYALLDPSGNAVQEPQEADLGTLRHYRQCVVCLFAGCNVFVFVVLTVYSLFRFYMWSCYTQYTSLTMALLNNASFPISLYDLKKLGDRCDRALKGTGVDDGIPCRPSEAQVQTMCRHPPPVQPPVGAGRLVAERVFGMEDFHGLSCMVPPPVFNATSGGYSDSPDLDICQLRNMIHPYDLYIFGSMALLICSTFCCRACGNRVIRRKKVALQARRATELTNATKHMTRS
jgi:hypothetical protein